MRRLICLLGGSLLALTSCEDKARLVDDVGEGGTGEESTETSGATGSGSDGQQSSTSASSSGTTGGSCTATQDTATLGFGVGGIVIFEPEPEFVDASVLRLVLWRGGGETGEGSQSVGTKIEQDPTSPTPFFIAVDPSDYIEDRLYWLTGEADMDGDGEYSCGDYTGDLIPVDLPDPDHDQELVVHFADGWCP